MCGCSVEEVTESNVVLVDRAGVEYEEHDFVILTWSGSWVSSF